MAVPTIDAVTTQTGSTGGSVTGSLPSGSGDFLVAFVGVDNNNAASATGWTQVVSQGCGGGSTDTTVTMLTAPSSVSSFVFSWTTDDTRLGHVTIFRISGAAGTVDASNSTGPATGNSTSTTRAIPSLTTTVNDCLLLSGVSCDSTNGTSYTWPTSNGWTEQSDLNTSGGETLSTASSSQGTAGSITGGDVTSSNDHHAIIVASFGPTTGLGGTLGVTTETDTSIAVAGKAKDRAVGVITATENSQALGATKTRALAVTTETEEAISLGTPTKTLALGVATETDLAVAIGSPDIVEPILPAEEADSSQPVVATKTKTIGTAVETDTAVSIGVGDLGGVVSTTTEADTALAITATKTRAIGTALETETPGSVTRPLFRFTTPTWEKVFERPPLTFGPKVKLTQSVSVVRINGVLTTRQTPTPELLQAAGSEGVDWFLGGRLYDVSQQVAGALVAAGFEVTQL